MTSPSPPYVGRARWVRDMTGWTAEFDPPLNVPARTKFDVNFPPPPELGGPPGWFEVQVATSSSWISSCIATRRPRVMAHSSRYGTLPPGCPQPRQDRCCTLSVTQPPCDAARAAEARTTSRCASWGRWTGMGLGLLIFGAAAFALGLWVGVEQFPLPGLP